MSTAETSASDVKGESAAAEERAAATPRFEKPSPGSWTLDASHCERPLPRFLDGVYEDAFGRGFAEALRAYGALLERIEAAVVEGFIYTCARPLGAPPESKGPPPRFVLRVLMWLHPELRRRNRRAARVFEERPWRAETRLYLEEWVPPLERRLEALLAADVRALDDGALRAHLAACRQLILDDTFVHHRMNCSRVVPVGDFLVHVRGWTGASATEALEALRGSSPYSETGLAEMRELAARVRAEPDLSELLRAGGDPERVVSELEAREGAIGEAMRAWMARVGHQPTGFSPAYPSLRESPSTLVESLRGAVASADRPSEVEERAARAAAALRERVPEGERATFDALLEEARSVYFIRDHSCFLATACFGAARRALLEAGRRLVERGALDDREQAFDLTPPELDATLDRAAGPSRAEIRRRARWRTTATSDQVPERLGPPPGSPPPPEWLPPGPARLARAIDAYVGAMFDEAERREDRALVKGLSASGGVRVGTARLVLEPGHFDRVREGDVLVARITTPAYNVLLPLLAGIVTDRGGILSHPAIVSREYGIPGVVGTRTATQVIPDGARVEIDGDSGTVRVLA